MNEDHVAFLQEQICRKYDAAFLGSVLDEVVGVADSVKGTALPLHGLRHPPTAGTTGWYIWAGVGEPSKSKEFFKPMHLKHLIEMRPELISYLGLPPGWRFLIDPPGDHEDVWRDDDLLLLEE